MSVKSKVRSRSRKVSNTVVVAADLLKESHPLHNSFVRFCRGNCPTKRQARKFLAKYPQFQEYKNA